MVNGVVIEIVSVRLLIILKDSSLMISFDH